MFVFSEIICRFLILWIWFCVMFLEIFLLNSLCA